MQIKRTLAFVDDVAIEAGQPVTPPLRKVAVVAIFDNPFAGKFEKDLSPLTEASEEIGRHDSQQRENDQLRPELLDETLARPPDC